MATPCWSRIRENAHRDREHLALGAGNRFGKNNLSNGPDDLLAIFGANAGHVFWKEDFESEGSYTSSVVFRLSKRET